MHSGRDIRIQGNRGVAGGREEGVAACRHPVFPAQPDPTSAHLDVPKTVVAKLVHKTVQECGGSPGIHSEFPLRCEIVGLLRGRGGGYKWRKMEVQ